MILKLVVEIEVPDSDPNEATEQAVQGLAAMIGEYQTVPFMVSSPDYGWFAAIPENWEPTQ
jgi:hypothetical protein